MENGVKGKALPAAGSGTPSTASTSKKRSGNRSREGRLAFLFLDPLIPFLVMGFQKEIAAVLSKVSLQVLAVIVALTILSGCTARSIPLRKEDRETIKAVRVSDQVKVTDELVFHDNRDLAGLTMLLGGVLVGGVIGGVAMAVLPDNGSVFVNFVKQGRLEIRKIVTEAFTEELKKRQIFNIADISNVDADGQFYLEVKPLGLGQARPFSNDLRPILGIIAQLKKRDESVIWQKHYYIANLNTDTPAHNFKEYMENSGLLLKEAFTIAAGIVVSELIDDLEKSN